MKISNMIISWSFQPNRWRYLSVDGQPVCQSNLESDHNIITFIFDILNYETSNKNNCNFFLIGCWYLGFSIGKQLDQKVYFLIH